jgi:hypothetical protein
MFYTQYRYKQQTMQSFNLPSCSIQNHQCWSSYIYQGENSDLAVRLITRHLANKQDVAPYRPDHPSCTSLTPPLADNSISPHPATPPPSQHPPRTSPTQTIHPHPSSKTQPPKRILQPPSSTRFSVWWKYRSTWMDREPRSERKARATFSWSGTSQLNSRMGIFGR